MGAPAKTDFQNYADWLEARLALDLAGFKSEYGSQTVTSLFGLVDAASSGDPFLQNALGPLSAPIDVQSYPENFAKRLADVFGNSVTSYYSQWVAGVNAFLATAHGGSNAPGNSTSLDAYLTAVGGSVGPLFAELARYVLSQQDASLSPANVFAPLYQCVFPARVYAGTDAGSFTDETAAAASATAADMTPLWAANGDALYIGCTCQFLEFVLALSTLGSGTITPAFQVWSGSAWVAVPGLVDSSVGFTLNRPVKYTQPVSWEKTNKDASGQEFADKTPYYYVRISRGNATLTTPPVGTCLTLVPAPVNNANGKNLGLPQGPLAIGTITGASTVAWDILQPIEWSRFNPPSFQARALTPIAQNLTVTLSYTNQSGVIVAQSQGSWTAPAALGTKAATFNGADTGIRSVTNAGTVSTTAVDGCFAIESIQPRTPAK